MVRFRLNILRVGIVPDSRDDGRDDLRDDVRDDVSVDVRDAPVIQAPGGRLRQPASTARVSRLVRLDCAKNAWFSARTRQHFTSERNSS